MRWLRRTVVGGVGVVLVAVAAGAGYEAYARHRAASDYPPPGRLVDVGGGRRIHLDCRGTGSPTVVFESGQDDTGSLSWAKVHDEVAATTRACAYDRAGILWSDPRDAPVTAAGIAADLHTALAAAGEKGPFVLVAHSLGGAYAMTYTQRYGDQVGGLVLVDASHPDQLQRFAEVMPEQPDYLGIFRVMSVLSWTGLPRLLQSLGPAFPNMPDAVAARVQAYSPTSLRAVVAEGDAVAATLQGAGAALTPGGRPLGKRPLVVLTAGAPTTDAELKEFGQTREQADGMQQAWLRMQDDEATWSSRSRHEVVADATHFIQFDRPDRVVATVREVVAAVRSGSGVGSAG